MFLLEISIVTINHNCSNGMNYGVEERNMKMQMNSLHRAVVGFA